MRNFATESGKSKGEFYTPAEVSRIMAKVIGIGNTTRASQTIYDPTCGSGSLLLKAADEAPVKVTIYGQENDQATSVLAKMNMILHDNPTAEIWKGNTLANPYFRESDGRLKQFDFAVANPPFSSKAWTTGLENVENDPYERFQDGIPPEKNGDYAFLQHVLRSLKSNGKGAIILPHGVLFRGNAEAVIRKNIIRRGYIKGIIGLPANLFYGTGIPACIIVIDKEKAVGRTGIFMIDASKDFTKDGNKNRLRPRDVRKIVDVFNGQIELAGYSRMVPHAEISDPKNDFNLNIPRYIDSTEPEDRQDIEAHLLGGIPNRDLDALGRYWQIFPTLAASLFSPADREGYSQLTITAAQVRPTIFSHPEFLDYKAGLEAVFTQWRNKAYSLLKDLTIGGQPKALITTLGDSLLDTFKAIPLIDKYDVYQHLMRYWETVMQDDVYLVVVDGWMKANKLRRLIKDTVTKKYTESHDFEVGKERFKADLIPPNLIIARYFAEEQAALSEIETRLEEVTQSIQELDDEHGGEDGLLKEAKAESGKLTTASVKAAIKKLDKSSPDDAEQWELLTVLQDLQTDEARLKAEISAAHQALYTHVLERYAILTEDDVKTLVIEDKWLAVLDAVIQTELDRVAQALAGRIKQLAERYATPLPVLEQRARDLSEKVTDHLKKMGYSWNQ
jgi:type I restriction enzyme M protein